MVSKRNYVTCKEIEKEYNVYLGVSCEDYVHYDTWIYEEKAKAWNERTCWKRNSKRKHQYKEKNTMNEEEKKFYEKCYDGDQVRELMEKNNLQLEHFYEWIYGQTGLMITKDGKNIFGYFKWDVERYINARTKGKVPVVYD